MNHSFNVEIAQEYSVEKAVIINNFYYWIKENAANGRNIYHGRAYTYNTAEALAELFPYFKPRKIAELLRQLEADGLILSAQTHGTNRVKSYTLTEKALEFYTSVHDCKTEESKVQKSDVATYGKATMEHTEIEQCSITNIKHTNINTDINANADIGTDKEVGTNSKKRKTKKFIAPTEEEVREYCRANNYDLDVSYFMNWYDPEKTGTWKDKKGTPVTNWKRCVITWVNNSKKWASEKQQQAGGMWGKENNIADKYADLLQE